MCIQDHLDIFRCLGIHEAAMLRRQHNMALLEVCNVAMPQRVAGI